jgi:mRNA (guanine-N7-)-methyltransferase
VWLCKLDRTMPAFDPVRDAVRNSPVTPSADFSSYNPYDSQQSPSSPSTPALLSPSLGRRATRISALLNDDSGPPPNRPQHSASLSRILHTEPDAQAIHVTQSPNLADRHRDQPGQSPSIRRSSLEVHSFDPKLPSMSRSRPPAPAPSSPKPKIPYNPRRMTPAQSVLVPMSEEESIMYKSYIGVGAARLKKRKREGSAEPDDLEQRPAKKKTRDVQAVVQHYNARPDVGVAQRQNSPIYGLKSFNNWVKSVLITRFAHPALGQGMRQGPRAGKVLEMGCGKGGDLTKWTKAKIKELVAVDIASVSVDQAQARWAQTRRFEATFAVLDCYVDSLASVVPTAILAQPFDVVSMQFCMHYAFEKESKARCMLENVTRWLRPGGIFLGTIPNSELLL